MWSQYIKDRREKIEDRSFVKHKINLVGNRGCCFMVLRYRGGRSRNQCKLVVLLPVPCPSWRPKRPTWPFPWSQAYLVWLWSCLQPRLACRERRSPISYHLVIYQPLGGFSLSQQLIRNSTHMPKLTNQIYIFRCNLPTWVTYFYLFIRMLYLLLI